MLDEQTEVNNDFNNDTANPVIQDTYIFEDEEGSNNKLDINVTNSPYDDDNFSDEESNSSLDALE
ncbi:6483_t:CDS:1, partial [Gigaspora margarita]